MKVVWLSALGGALEFYDFMIFVFLAGVMSPQYFPADNQLNSLLIFFATFAAGYFARPVGGLIFSHYGDIVGRKKTFYLSIILMAIPSLLIALLPTYAHIGLAAPILLVIFRLVQGMAVGGELPGAITFIYEHIGPKRSGMMIALIFVALSLSILFAQAVIAVLHLLLSSHAFYNWGWRLAFVIGAGLAFIGAMMRKDLQETPAFQQLKVEARDTPFPVMDLFKGYYKQFIQGFIIVGLGSICMLLLLVYLPVYIAQFRTSFIISASSLHLFNLFNLIIFTTSMFIMGSLSDQLGRKKLIAIGSLLIAMVSYPLFHLLLTGSIIVMFISQIILGIIFSMVVGCYGPLLPEVFPTKIRYTGIGLTYNFAFALIGGTTPFIVTLLIKLLEQPLAPAYYLSFFGILSFIAVITITTQEPLAAAPN